MDKRDRFPLKKDNYIILIIGVVMVLLGFILMSGGGSEDPNVFNGEELFSTRRITVAPIVVLLGFAVVAYGIIKKPKED